MKYVLGFTVFLAAALLVVGGSLELYDRYYREAHHAVVLPKADLKSVPLPGPCVSRHVARPGAHARPAGS